MTESKKDCWCFPTADVLHHMYMKNMKDKVLAEKSLHRIIKSLENANVKDFKMVSLYATVSEYDMVPAKNVEPDVINDLNIDKISEALNMIATPCECKKFRYLV